MAQEIRSLSSEAAGRPLGKEVYAFGPVRVDVARHVVTRDGQPVALAPKTFELLLILVRSGGRALSRQELVAALWPDTFVEEANLSFQISTLRKSLGDGADHLVETVPKVGYRFTPQVTHEGDVTRALATPTPGGPGALRRHTRVAAAVTCVAALLVAAWFASSSLGRETPTPPVTSLAVVPFDNRTGDPGIDYISDGIAASVIQRLSRVAGLKVISQTAVQYARKGGDDPQAIGRAVGVESVLTGRLVKRDTRLALALELLDARDARHLWGHRYEVDLRELATLEQAIPVDLVERLRLTLSAASKRQLARTYTDDAEAHELYLKGRYAWQKSKSAGPSTTFTVQSAKQALAFFEEAIRRDPDYALAYAGLADTYLSHATVGAAPTALEPGAALTRQEAERRGRAAAMKALSLNPELAEVHSALAALRWRDWDFTGAEKAYTRALELNPNYAEARHMYAHLLLELGRVDEALRECQAYLALDPVTDAPMGHVVGQYAWARQYDDAIAWAAKLEQLYPDAIPWNLCEAYYGKGMFEKTAECIFKRDEGALTPTQLGDLRSAFARAGINGLFRVRIAQLKVATDENHRNIVDIAALYARLGETEEAFRYLEQAYAMRAISVAAIRADVRFDNVRGDPRFADLLRRIGLPPLK